MSNFKTLVIYSKETGDILLAWTPDITPDGQELGEKDLPEWFDPAIHGVLHDRRRPELHALHPTKVDENGNPLHMIDTLRARVVSEEVQTMRIMSTSSGIFNSPLVELVDKDTPRANPDDPLS